MPQKLHLQYAQKNILFKNYLVYHHEILQEVHVLHQNVMTNSLLTYFIPQNN